MGGANSVSKDCATIASRSLSQESFTIPPSHVHQTSDVVGSAEIAMEFDQTYEFIRILGRGASAEVHLIRDKATGAEYACKIVKKSNAMNDAKTMETEAAIMKRLSNGHLLTMHEIYETDDSLRMVLEFADGGDLMHGLSRDLPVYNERNIAKVFKQILEGVKYLHSQGIVHRDLKMDNLLYSRVMSGEIDGGSSSASLSTVTTSLSSSSSSDVKTLTKTSSGSSGDDSFPIQVKIADFGLSALTESRRIDTHNRVLKPACETKVQNYNRQLKSLRVLKDMWGTLEYFAPEIYTKTGYGPQVDIWALGCILFEMLRGEIAFPSRELPTTTVEKVMTQVGLQKKWKRSFELKDGWKELSPSVQSLIKGMLKRNPMKRFDVDECLRHPWIVGAEENSEMDYDYDHELKHAKKIVIERSERRVKRYELLVKELEREEIRNKAIASLIQ